MPGILATYMHTYIHIHTCIQDFLCGATCDLERKERFRTRSDERVPERVVFSRPKVLAVPGQALTSKNSKAVDDRWDLVSKVCMYDVCMCIALAWIGFDQ